MKVSIKDFDVAMDVKNKGIELDICDTTGVHLGDLVVTKTRLIWCKGRQNRKNGKEVTWEAFMTYMENL
jgi:hypothetical protein